MLRLSQIVEKLQEVNYFFLYKLLNFREISKFCSFYRKIKGYLKSLWIQSCINVNEKNNEISLFWFYAFRSNTITMRNYAMMQIFEIKENNH